MDHTEVREIATKKLGVDRLVVDKALGELPSLLVPCEPVLAMAVATVPRTRARLLVATDRRLLLIDERPFVPRRRTHIVYQQIAWVRVVRSPDGVVLIVRAAGAETWLEGLSEEAGRKLVSVIGARAGDRKVSSEDRRFEPSETLPAAGKGGARANGRRTAAILAAAAIATGVGAGVLVKAAEPSADEVTCAELAEDPTASLELAEELAGERDASEIDALMAEFTIVDELDRACERADDPSYRPVNSDFRGSIGRELRDR